MALNDTTCRNAKAKDKPYKISDEKGMFLLVNPNGSKWWRLKYRIEGREKLLSLGVYPDVSLREARERRDDARKIIANGSDPSAAKQAKRAAVKAKAEALKLVAAGQPMPGSFEAIAREWWANVHAASVSEAHAERTLLRLQQKIFPWIGGRPLGEIEPPELLACLRRISQGGAVETAHRAKDACSQVFRYGIAGGHCKRNPAADLKDALPPTLGKHLAAITQPKEAGELLRAMAGYKGDILTRVALELSALLFLRPGELRQLEWAWIDWDEATIRLPASLMKRRKEAKLNGAPHIVPLAPQSLKAFRELQPLTGQGRLIFPSRLSNERPMSENTVNAALRRLGYANDEMTAHGFRAMARTMAAERLGVPPEVIEAQLAHEVPDALGRAYNRTQFIEQRRELMELWANFLDQLRDGKVIQQTFGKAA